MLKEGNSPSEELQRELEREMLAERHRHDA